MIRVVFTATVIYANGDNENVGEAICYPGWIQNVHVELEDADRDAAHGCGIGTVLIELCLLDPALKNKDPLPRFVTNKSILFMRNGPHPRELNQLQTYCRGVMGFIMHATTLHGESRATGNAFLTAAIRQGYSLMMIFAEMDMFYYYTTAHAKQIYQQTGVFSEFTSFEDWTPYRGMPRKLIFTKQCPEFNAWGKLWFFCQNP